MIIKTVKYIYALFSIFFLTQDIAASQCRNELHEGWSWASTFQYRTTPHNQNNLDFKPIHEYLAQMHLDLGVLLNLTRRNVCTAQINVVIEPIGGGVPQLVTQVAENDQNQKYTFPLSSHVFISGTEKPESTGKAKFFNEIECDKESNKWADKKLTTCQVGVEASGLDAALKTNYIFIHPCKPYYIDMAAVVERLIERYRNVSYEKLPIKARLARDWVLIHQPREKSKGIRRFLKNLRQSRTISQSIQSTLIERENEWFDRANDTWPPHSEEGHQETENVFFTNTSDSEQKLFYYLDFVTGYTQHFRQLEQCMDTLENWYVNSGAYRARLIKCLMCYCDPSPTIRKDASSSPAPKDEDSPAIRKNEALTGFQEVFKASFEVGLATESWVAINNYLQAFLTFCDTEKEKVGTNNYRLNKLHEYVGTVLRMGEALAQGIEDPVLGLKKELTKQCAFSTSKGDIPDADFVRLLREHRIKKNNMNIHESIIENWLKPENLFKALRFEREFKNDLLIVSFDEFVTNVLINNPGMRIATVVLNIHSTHDICYGCAPDLAQESLRTDSFAAYFKRRAHQLNLHYNRVGEEPSFRPIYSCGTVREKARCFTCAFEQRPMVEPLWGKTEGIVFYQHLLKGAPHGKVAEKKLAGEIKEKAKVVATSSTSTAYSIDSDEEGDVRRPQKKADKEPLIQPSNMKQRKNKKAREKLPGNDDD